MGPPCLWTAVPGVDGRRPEQPLLRTLGLPRPLGAPVPAEDVVTTRPAPAARPLLVTGAPDLLDDVLRLAASAGIDLDVTSDPGGVRRRWSGAPLVLVGADLTTALLPLELPRRDDVVLLGDDLDDAGVWQVAVELGAERVAFLPDAEEWLLARFADLLDGAGGEGRLVGVLGGRGGAGATTLACALAVTAARLGRDALLVDADPLGGGIDLVLGGESDSGLRWSDLQATRGRVPASALADALPRMAGLPVLSWDRGGAPTVPIEAVQAVLGAGRRAHELVVVDLARSTDELTRAVLGLADCVLLVVPAEVRAAAAAARVASAAGLLCRDLRVVVRGPGPSGLDGPVIARALGLPLAGTLRPEPGLDVALEQGRAPSGRGRGPLAELCTGLLRELVPGLRRAA